MRTLVVTSPPAVVACVSVTLLDVDEGWRWIVIFAGVFLLAGIVWGTLVARLWPEDEER